MQEIQEGAVYVHPEGIKYRVDSVILDATSYESGQKPQPVVLYTQLDAGSYPVGTKWVREKQDFMNVFKIAE